MDMDVGVYRKLLEKGKIVAFSNTKEGYKKTIHDSDADQHLNMQLFNSETTINLPI